MRLGTATKPDSRELFQRRLQQIESVSASQRQEKSGVLDTRLLKKAIEKEDRREPAILRLFMILFAAGVGASSLIVARAINFHFIVEGPILEKEIVELLRGPFGDIMLSVVIAAFLGLLFRLGTGMRPMVLVAAMGATFWGWDLILMNYPEAFAVLFSSDYVTQYTARV